MQRQRASVNPLLSRDEAAAAAAATSAAGGASSALNAAHSKTDQVSRR